MCFVWVDDLCVRMGLERRKKGLETWNFGEGEGFVTLLGAWEKYKRGRRVLSSILWFVFLLIINIIYYYQLLIVVFLNNRLYRIYFMFYNIFDN